VRVQAHILNGLYHVQACFHAAHRVIRSRLPVVALELRHTVVTIAQQLHAQTVVVLGAEKRESGENRRENCSIKHSPSARTQKTHTQNSDTFLGTIFNNRKLHIACVFQFLKKFLMGYISHRLHRLSTKCNSQQ